MMKHFFLLATALFLIIFVSAQIPKKAQDAYIQGKALVEQGKYADALAFFKKATEAYPSYFDAYLQAGIAFGKLSLNNDAKFCYNKAIQLRPNACQAYISFGIYFKEIRSNSDSALMFFEKADKLKCDTSSILYFNMGWCYNEKNQYEKAITYLKKAIGLDSAYKNAISEISFSFRKQEKAGDGIEYFQLLYNKTKLDIYMYYIGLFSIHIKDKGKATLALEELKNTQSKLAIGLEKKVNAMQ